MATYVYNNGWQQLTGTDRPYVYDGANWQGVKQIYAYDNGAWRQAYQYDNTGPTIASLSAVDTTAAFNTDSGMQRVTWGAITDNQSGVASATLSRWFYSSDGVWQAEQTWNISSSLSGSYLDLSVPTTRRKQGSGVTWYTYYRITTVDNAGNSSTLDAGFYSTTTYDVTAPSVSPPSSSPNGSSYDVSWGAITDGGMGVSSATIYSLYYGTSSGFVAGSSYAIPSGSFGGGSTTFGVPTNRRNTPGGETWVVYYYIIATDAAGNSYQTGGSTSRYTRPYGTYNISANSSRSYDSVIPRWFPTDFSDPTDVRAGNSSTTTMSNYTGLFFYGTKLADACLGFEPDNATLFAQRNGGSGNSGTYRFAPCTNGSQPGGAPSVNTSDVVDVYLSGESAAANVPIINWATNISSGSVGSIALIPTTTSTSGNTSNFRRMHGAGQGLYGLGGTVTLSFN
jgi:hypothetical protein